MKRALFLDRDGVINVNHGYVHTVENFEFIEGVFDICRVARARGYALLVVTNQAGIGRGYYTEDTFHALTSWMCAQFRQQDCEIAQVYFCPDHPTHGVGVYRRESAMRKPAPGMILQAAHEHGIDLRASVLVGDKQTDIQAGTAAGVGINVLFDPTASFCRQTRVIQNLRQLSLWLD